MTYFRTIHSSWYQVPVLYDWWDLETSGATDDDRPVACRQRRHGTRLRHRARGAPVARDRSAHAQPRSSGAIVRPASFSCSQ